LGKKKEKDGVIPAAKLGNPQLRLHYLLGSSKGAVGGPPLTQMSRDWIRDRAQREAIDAKAKRCLTEGREIRRVVLVTLMESDGARDHAEATTWDSKTSHETHGITQTWNAADIDAVVEARNKVFTTKKPSSTQTKKR
jgi:hypothetical protein